MTAMRICVKITMHHILNTGHSRRGYIGHRDRYLEDYSDDGYYTDYYYGYGANDDWMLIGMEATIFGSILIAIICCIGFIISILAGCVMHKWIGSYSTNAAASKELRRNRYQHVINHDIDQI